MPRRPEGTSVVSLLFQFVGNKKLQIKTMLVFFLLDITRQLEKKLIGMNCNTDLFSESVWEFATQVCSESFPVGSHRV